MLEGLGEKSFARGQVDSVVTNAYTFSHDPATLYLAREQMAQRIVATPAAYHCPEDERAFHASRNGGEHQCSDD